VGSSFSCYQKKERRSWNTPTVSPRKGWKRERKEGEGVPARPLSARGSGEKRGSTVIVFYIRKLKTEKG